MSNPRTAWFHEDDFCQIELLPSESDRFIRAQMQESDDFADAHRAEGGGWTDVYVRESAPIPLANLGITLSDLTSCIPAVCTPFDRVTTGYGSHTENADSARAWGAGATPLVFAGTNKDNIVQYVWFASFAASDVETMRLILTNLSRRWPLIYVDWWWSQIVPLHDAAAIERYLSLRGEAGKE